MTRIRLLAAVAALWLGIAAGARAQTVNLNLYGDLNWLGFNIDAGPTPVLVAGRPIIAPNSTSVSRAFKLPRVATVLSSSLGRLSLVNETTFTAPINQGSNSLQINVERFEIVYQVAEWLRLKAGRFHTAFGYYNDAYHTGFYYQLTFDRPGFVNYEDNGGLIPARAVGIHADGRIPLPWGEAAGSIHYDLELINNRGRNITEIPLAADYTTPRAFNARLRYEPGGALEGLIVGGNFYYSHIKGSTQPVPGSSGDGGQILQLFHLPWPGNVQIPDNLQVNIPNYLETTFGAHVAYLEHNVHLIAEYGVFNHQDDAGNTVTSKGGFVEIGYMIGWDVTPYYLLDRIDLASAGGANNFTDPYFAYAIATQIFGSQWRHGVGLRWQPVDGLALKIGAGKWLGDGGTNVTYVNTQAAVAF